MTADREQVRRDAEQLIRELSAFAEGLPLTMNQSEAGSFIRALDALLSELEQSERERDEAKRRLKISDEDEEVLVQHLEARLASVPALVEALRKIADEGECSMNLGDQCVGAVHSRRKRWDNPERVERVGCAKHYAEAALTVYEQSQGNG